VAMEVDWGWLKERGLMLMKSKVTSDKKQKELPEPRSGIKRVQCSSGFPLASRQNMQKGLKRHQETFS